jgi:hypothetical protein
MKRFSVILFVIFGLTAAGWCDSSQSSRKHRHARRPAASKKAVPNAAASNPVPSDADEEERYEAIKAEAKADPRIRDLKEKADSAVGDDAARNAAIAYYRALFQRIRETDKTLTERADLAEEAMMRRLAPQ